MGEGLCKDEGIFWCGVEKGGRGGVRADEGRQAGRQEGKTTDNSVSPQIHFGMAFSPLRKTFLSLIYLCANISMFLLHLLICTPYSEGVVGEV